MTALMYIGRIAEDMEATFDAYVDDNPTITIWPVAVTAEANDYFTTGGTPYQDKEGIPFEQIVQAFFTAHPTHTTLGIVNDYIQTPAGGTQTLIDTLEDSTLWQGIASWAWDDSPPAVSMFQTERIINWFHFVKKPVNRYTDYTKSFTNWAMHNAVGYQYVGSVNLQRQTMLDAPRSTYEVTRQYARKLG